jgi:hypothetical protein
MSKKLSITVVLAMLISGSVLASNCPLYIQCEKIPTDAQVVKLSDYCTCHGGSKDCNKYINTSGNELLSGKYVRMIALGTYSRNSDPGLEYNFQITNSSGSKTLCP